MTLSRRSFAQLLGTGAAFAWSGGLQAAVGGLKPAAPLPIRLSSNENPYGPSPAAIAAMRDAFAIAARYPDDEADLLAAEIAKLHGVSTDHVLLGNGSSEILKVVAAAFTSASRPVVMASPTFEAIARYAKAAGAGAVEVPLDASYAHDATKMAAVPNAGVVYVCNPNNPTGSITPATALRSLVESTSAIVLVDEAYHHYAADPRYESVIPLVSARPNLVVARTFSKIYGMAGLRAGYAIAQPALIRKLAAQQSWDSMNLMALVAARASLGDSAYLADGKKRNAATKKELLARLERLGYRTVPSETNFVMIDLRREVRPVIGALRERGVRVGRVFPAMPQHLRVTIGKPEEMERFLAELRLAVG